MRDTVALNARALRVWVIVNGLGIVFTPSSIAYVGSTPMRQLPIRSAICCACARKSH